MNNLYHVIYSIGLFVSGMVFFSSIISWEKYFHKKKFEKKIDGIFNEILIGMRVSTFMSRLDNKIEIKTTIFENGEVIFIYFMDTYDMAIFKNGQCLYTSKYCRKELIQKIIDEIYKYFGNDINDCVKIGVLGSIVDKKNFEVLKNNILFIHSEMNKNNIPDEIILSTDMILEKINKIGINNLTKEEKEFLDKQSRS